MIIKNLCVLCDAQIEVPTLLYMCACVLEFLEATAQCWLSPGHPLPYFLRHDLSLNLELTDFARLAGHRLHRSSCLRLHLPRTGTTGMNHHILLFLWMLGTKLRPLCFLGRQLYISSFVFPNTSCFRVLGIHLYLVILKYITHYFNQ